MRCILVILDGIGDRGQPCFDGKTLLQVAHTPNLDYLASIGMNGLYHSFLQGIPMSSETAHFLIFGYDLVEFPGRGVVEALGEGIKIADQDISILCHLCSVERKDNNLLLKHGCPELDNETGFMLKESIKEFQYEGIQFNLIHTKNIHGFLILRGNVSELITDSDPIYEGRALIKVLPINNDQVSKKTAFSLNKYLTWCYEILSKHYVNQKRIATNNLPINALVTQRAGKRKKIMPFKEKWGLRGLSISSGSVYWGLCSELGFNTIKVKDSGNIEEDLKYRLHLAREAYDYDFIHVHTKMPDDELPHQKSN